MRRRPSEKKFKNEIVRKEHQNFFTDLADLFIKHKFSLDSPAEHQPFLKSVDKKGNLVFYVCPEISSNGTIILDRTVIYGSKPEDETN